MEQSAAAIWKQDKVPVIYRQGNGPLLVRLPYSANNREWLRSDNLRKPLWIKQYSGCWQIPNNWFNDLAHRMLQKFPRLYVIQPHRVMEKCAPACWNATALDCQCSCMGKNHGSQQALGRWWIVSETCALKWRGRELACQLIERASAKA